MRTLGLLLLAAVGLASCSLLGPRSFQVALDRWAEVNDEQVIVTLTDFTGRVIAIDRPPPGAQPQEDVATALNGDDLAIVVAWLGGACDESVALRLEDRGDGLHIAGTIEVAPVDCEAIGIVRAIVIRFLAPVNPSDVIVDVSL